jgi:hypothetical protein
MKWVSIAAAHKPKIIMRNAKRWLEWYKAHHHLTLEQWKQVIWSDESRFNICQCDGQMWFCQEHATCPNA